MRAVVHEPGATPIDGLSVDVFRADEMGRCDLTRVPDATSIPDDSGGRLSPLSLVGGSVDYLRVTSATPADAPVDLSPACRR